MDKISPFISAILIVFLALLLVKCLQPTIEMRDVIGLGTTVITGIFALVQSRKPEEPPTPPKGDTPDA